MSKYVVLFGPYFPVFGPEKTPYLYTFQAVCMRLRDRGGSSSNCPRFTKIYPFLFVPHACFTLFWFLQCVKKKLWEFKILLLYSRIRPRKFVPILFVAWNIFVSLQTPRLHNVTFIHSWAWTAITITMNGIYHIPQLSIDDLYKSKTSSDSIFKVKVLHFEFSSKLFLPFKV